MQRCKYLLLSKGKTSNGSNLFICKKRNEIFLSSNICNSCENFTPLEDINNNKNKGLEYSNKDYNKKDILKLFPFNEFRVYQEDIIIKAYNYLSKGKNIILSAPTGFGKSAVNITLCRHYNKSYYVVATKNLQDQIEEKFGRYVSILKGRSNYICNITKRPADRCIKLHKICPYGKEHLFCDICNYPCQCKYCEYEQEKKDAERARIVVTNMAMLMTAEFLTKRDLIIVDEAHKLEDIIRSNISVTFRNDKVEKFGLPKLPYYDDFGRYIRFLQRYRDELKVRQENLLKEIREETSKGITTSRISRIKDINEINEMIDKIDFILDDYKQFKEEWGTKKSDTEISFFPITAKRFLNKVLGKGDQFVLSSATSPFKEELGPFGGNLELIAVPSSFPVKNRPIYLDYVGSMSFSNREKTIPKVAEKIKELATDRTIVHCHSYKIANGIARNLKDLGVDYILQREGHREEDLERFKKKKSNIFLSINMEDGISLDDDICRVNILAKVPYPNFKDPQIERRRKLEGDRFIDIIVTRKIAQAYGRATRSENDWSRFYILDLDFKFFFNKNKDLFPEWFKETIVGR